ncbi:hypothetical protein ACIRRA_14900 [Nocardia sp. NPDC101769]|uniref:hypothetical protein n=1 Tax=Nocardia sp. NPDC101769 TaxID=3364333 RepID=UPI00382C2CF3
MIRKTVLVITAGILIGAPAMGTAGAAQPETATQAAPGAHDIAFSTGSGAADVVLNGLIAVIFGPDDPTKCKFPYCF